MGEKERVIVEVERQATEVLEADGYELVDLEYRREGGQWVLRLYIDREGGVTLDDCARVSRRVGDALEVSDPIEHAYTLEVSSPGLERPLKKPAHYERFRGRQIRIKTFAPVEGRKSFRGKLLGLSGGKVGVEVDGKGYEVPLSAIARANLDFEDSEFERDLAGAEKRGDGQ